MGIGLDLLGLDLVNTDDTDPLIGPLLFPGADQLDFAPLGLREGRDIRLDLLCQVGKRASSASEVSMLIDEVVPMTKQALKASASSVLLVDERNRELFFEFADGDAGQALAKMRISVESGIAGWVARHGEPLIVNDVGSDQRFCREVDKATGFVTRSVMCAPLKVRSKIIGVIEVLNKPDGSDFDAEDLEVLVSVASTAAMAIENARLHQTVMDGYKRTVKALAAAIDAKDPYTCGHSQRVKEYALLAARSLSLAPEELEAVEYAGILHDVGKIGIVDTTLRKPSDLEPDEWVIMRGHPSIGARIIGDVPFLEQAKKLVLHHHEKYDGTGYPGRLSKEDIPIGARVIAIADAFDTMTTDRAYRSALSLNHAITELRNCAGTQFCPVAVEAFIAGFQKWQRSLALLDRSLWTLP